MEERSLRITGADRNFFNKISTTLTKLLIPTKIGINGMLISMKRNNLLKAFENYTKEDKSNYDEEELEKKYETTYTAYLESLDKYVMDSIYKKVKNNTASEFEKTVGDYLSFEFSMIMQGRKYMFESEDTENE